MTKLLVVRAHPINNRESRSMKVTDAFVQSYIESHPSDSVEEINVYNIQVPEIDSDLLNAWDELAQGTRFYALSASQQHKVTLFDSLTGGFLEHDKIVVANPLWNLSIPTRLKAWFDTITVAGKTFKYTEQGSVGTVEGKKVLHIQANGGVYSGADPASQYVKTLFTFLGVSDFQQLFVEGMDQNPSQADEIVSNAIEAAKQLARSF